MLRYWAHDDLVLQCSPFLQGSPDLRAAKEVADYLGTVHHELHFTVQVLYLFSVFFAQ